MNYKEAINASQIWAARGYNDMGKCEVSVCHYGGKLMWLEGWGGNWVKKWKEIPEDKIPMLLPLRFTPTGPRPDDVVAEELLGAFDDEATDDPLDDEMQEAMAEIADLYELEEEDSANFFEPMGEAPED